MPAIGRSQRLQLTTPQSEQGAQGAQGKQSAQRAEGAEGAQGEQGVGALQVAQRGTRRRVGSAIAWLALLAVLLNGGAASAQDTATSPPEPSEAADARCDGRGFSTIFTCIPRDLRNMVRSPSLVWLAAGGGLSALSAPLDDRVDRALRDGDPDVFPKVGDQLGQAGLHFGAPFALYVVARATGHSETAGFAVTLLRAQVANGIVTRSLKFIPRARPYQMEARTGHGSFPSGHTSASFATATVVQRRFGWRAGLPAYVLASYVGISRLHRNHYLSDVAFGAGLGVAAGLAVNRPNRRAVVSPIIAPGAAGFTIDLRLAGGS
ncbi:MAG: phosphatase PAP2 family protein [Acidobacteria bacterium]|nr:phosphatase PAP2 family protein [Acidobacteriota bacterium]